MDFPIFNSKALSDGKVYDLNDAGQRRKYFKAKLGNKIEKIKEYLDTNTFVCFLVAKKGAGKGTYSGLFKEVIGEDRVVLLAMGDLVRDTHSKLEATPGFRDELKTQLEPYYRGPVSMDTAIDALLNRLAVTDKTAVPTEFMLALVKREIEKNKGKALFIDGFPREVDQITYSLVFRDIMNLRDDPDFFMLIDVSDDIIDARIKSRVICPICKTSRNTVLNPTKYVKFDKENNKYLLMCDNENCAGFKTEVMLQKENDDKGIELIRKRLDTDGALMEMIMQMHGIKRVLVRNSVPLDKEKEYVEDYELTRSYKFEANTDGSVTAKEELWIVNDDNGAKSYSLVSAAGVVSMISQIYDVILGD